MIVMKLLKNFNLKWAKTIGGQFSDYGLDVEKSASQGVYLVVGETFSYNGRDDKDAYFVRANEGMAKMTCEQSRVQVIGIKLKDEFISEDAEARYTDLDVKGEAFELENHVRLSFENIICIDNTNILTSERVK